MLKHVPHDFTAVVSYKVPFFDVDCMRVVWHGNYAKYFELAREAVLSRCGCGYLQMEKTDCVFPVVDLQVRYREPLLFEDEIAIRASVIEWGNRLKIYYEITKDGRLTTYGHTVQVAVERDSHEMRFELPYEVQQCFVRA